MPAMQLSRLSHAETTAWVETICARARASNAPHYRGAAAQLLRARVDRLVLEFLSAVKEESSSFAAYSRTVAEQRIAEGYHLTEMLAVLDILEDLAWSHCARIVTDREQLLKNLRLATQTLSAAKSALAQVYLDSMRDCEGTVAELKRELGQEEIDVLFKGTEAMVV